MTSSPGTTSRRPASSTTTRRWTRSSRGTGAASSSSRPRDGRTAQENFEQGRWNEYREFIGLNGLTADEAGRYDKKQQRVRPLRPGPVVRDAPADGDVRPAVRVPGQPGRPRPRREEGPRPGQRDRPAGLRDARRGQPALAARLARLQPHAEVRRPLLGRPLLLALPGDPHLPALHVERRRAALSLVALRRRSDGSGGGHRGARAGAAAGTRRGSSSSETSRRARSSRRRASSSSTRTSRTPTPTRRPSAASVELLGVSFGLEGTWAKSYDLQRMGDLNLVASANPAVDCPGIAPGVACYGGSSTAGGRRPARTRTTRASASTPRTPARSSGRRRSSSGRTSRTASGSSGRSPAPRDKDSDSNERNFSGHLPRGRQQPREQLRLLGSRPGVEVPRKRSPTTSRSRASSTASPAPSSRTPRAAPFTAVDQRRHQHGRRSGTDRPTVNGEHFARNTYRQPDNYTLDLRVGVGFSLGPGRLSVFGECFNCTDTANRGISASQPVLGHGPEAARDLQRHEHGHRVPEGVPGRDPVRFLTPRPFSLPGRYPPRP